MKILLTGDKNCVEQYLFSPYNEHRTHFMLIIWRKRDLALYNEGYLKIT